ncbi:MAG: DUF262 domain-containing protein [Holophagales bacterium]|nr:DUF262 domain-containing protein [Holophagales bacterium]MYD23860.1 DUF262 domain-containing protein [Holophagales bacterium]
MTQQTTVVHADAIRFSRLLAEDRSFAVPWHQRYYDWDRSNVKDLLEDLSEASKVSGDCYFLGAVILVERGQQSFEVNDGQQRIVTFSLICAAFCRRFARHDSDPQREAIALRALFQLEPTVPCSLEEADSYTPRLAPPQNDAAMYRQMIRGRSIGSNGKLTSAWQDILSFVDAMDQRSARTYFDYLVQKLEIACLWIPPHLDANEIYETINCRGKTLDDLDRIRNHFYSYVGHQGDDVRKETVHGHLERIRTYFPRGKVASDYLRCQLQIRMGFLRADHFYRDVRAELRSRQRNANVQPEELTTYIFGLVEDVAMPAALELYRKISTTVPDPDLTRQFDRASGRVNSPRGLQFLLHELSAYKVTFPIVFSLLYRYIQESDGRRRRSLARVVGQCLEYLATFVLRTAFVTQRFAPSLFEKKFAEYAKDTATCDLDEAHFVAFLRECDDTADRVLDGDRFVEVLAAATMKSGPKAKQLLLGLNRELQTDLPLLNENRCTLEHILPQAPKYWPGWAGFADVECLDWVNRIGNLTLLGPTDNRSGNFNESFEAKAAAYRQSSVALTRDVGRLRVWTPKAIEKRQLDMARRAAEVWAFPGK